MRAAVTPAHLLLLDHAFADDLVDRGFHERGGDDLAGAVALPVVGYGRGVRGEVPAELAYRLGEFVVPVLVLLAAGVLVFEVGGDVVDGLQRARWVSRPGRPWPRRPPARRAARPTGIKTPARSWCGPCPACSAWPVPAGGAAGTGQAEHAEQG